MENRLKSLIKKLSRLGFSVKQKEKDRIDPVCGMESTSNLFESDYLGKIYYFCSEHCKNQFDGNPGMYIK